MTRHIDELAEEAALLRAELDGGQPDPTDPGARERIRARLLALGREIDLRIRELEALRESLRPVAAQYRQTFREPPAGPRRFDHLGASGHRERGWSALSAGEFDHAIEPLRAAMAMDPQDETARAMLAWAYAGSGELKQSAALLQRLLRSDPGHPLGRMVSGYLELAHDRAAEAAAVLEAVTRDAEDITAVLYAYLYLGTAYTGLGRAREARAALRQALELAPHLAEAYWQLGRCHLREGRPDLALEAWRLGAENRFSAWGERCRSAARRLEDEGLAEPF